MSSTDVTQRLKKKKEMNIFIGNKRKIKDYQHLCKSVVGEYQLEIFWLHMTDNQTQMVLEQK